MPQRLSACPRGSSPVCWPGRDLRLEGAPKFRCVIFFLLSGPKLRETFASQIITAAESKL